MRFKTAELKQEMQHKSNRYCERNCRSLQSLGIHTRQKHRFRIGNGAFVLALSGQPIGVVITP